MTDTVNKIIKFKFLKSGWHYGEGVEFKDINIAFTLICLTAINEYGFIQTDTFPGLCGEIRVTGYRDNEYVECTVEDYNNITLIYEQENQEIFHKEKLNLKEFLDSLSELYHTDS
jgi:hypothetical protein